MMTVTGEPVTTMTHSLLPTGRDSGCLTPRCRQAAPPCPAWCDRDHGDDLYVHHSPPVRWINPEDCGDDWRVEVSLYRGDDWMHPHPIGDTAIDLYISGDGSMIDAGDEDRPELSGYLMPNDLRNLARWLLQVAEHADPPHQRYACRTR